MRLASPTANLLARGLATVEKSIDWDGAGSGTPEETQYIYAGDQIALAFDGDDALLNRYLYGPDIDQILADEQFDPTTSGEMPTADGDMFWMLADNLGSVRDIVEHDSTNGTTVANHITYDSYGAVTSETDDTVEHIFGYTGRERDEESDLQYNRARYFDGATGRWISEDPLGFAAGDSNLNRYVGNGPTNATDPSGLVPIRLPWNQFLMWMGRRIEAALRSISTKRIIQDFMALHGPKQACHIIMKNKISGLVTVNLKQVLKQIEDKVVADKFSTAAGVNADAFLDIFYSVGTLKDGLASGYLFWVINLKITITGVDPVTKKRWTQTRTISRTTGSSDEGFDLKGTKLDPKCNKPLAYSAAIK